jgi:diguanylate cyclase (GGDEF)-like protein
MAEANRPIIRGYLAIMALYYGAMAPVHFWALDGSNLITMVFASLLASAVATACWQKSRQEMSADKLELIAGSANLLVYANVMLAMNVSKDPANLVYFVMMAMGFAFTGVSVRMSVVSIVLVLVSLYVETTLYYPEQQATFGYITFAAALTALAVTTFLRRALLTAIRSKEVAELRLGQAERLTEKMRQRSLSDSLTGLPNRRAFFSVLNSRIGQAKGPQGDWLVLLDLDGFKMVNDVYGHIMGDKLLKAVTARLSEYCGSNAHVSRMGGDEFNFILLDTMTMQDCQKWCEALLEKIAEPYDVDDRLIQISASAGSIKVNRSDEIGQLIRNADYALLHAKKHGKNRVVVFNDQHAKDAMRRFEVEDALRSADFPAEIEIVFQPQFDLGQSKVVSAEALARWNSPTLGTVQPDRFIKIAEESGLISRITLAVLGKSIEALKSWENPIPLSINLSGHDLLSNQIMNEIIALLAKSKIDPALLEFEITETAMMADTQKACENLNRLSKLGHSIALDDFGTGYSNFNYLRELPIDKLKVDRSFVEDIGNPMTEKILHSLAVTANALGVDCLLEGIEHELQLIMAKRVGANSVQGYLFGKPMSNTQLVELIEDAVAEVTREEDAVQILSAR